MVAPCTSFFILTLASLAHSIPTSFDQIPIRPQQHSQGYTFDPLLHLPGISRYFDAVGFGLRHEAPEGCQVTVASYLIRHSAIYANDDEYEDYIRPLLWKLEKARGLFTGPLEFLNQWHSPILEDELEHITPHGLLDAARVGDHLHHRYAHLVPSLKKIHSDKKSRCYDTAKAFVQSYPNRDSIEIVKFGKPRNGSMNPIIPHKSCHAFSKRPGTDEMWEFVHTYAVATSARLAPYSPFKLHDKDVVAMQSICGYESAITGETSKICSVFTDVEWMNYEYAWDLRYAHMVGPLNPMSNYLGFPWLQAQNKILQNIDQPGNANRTFNMNGDIVDDNDRDPGIWSPSQRFFLSFTHREVPPLIATALGIFNSSFEDKGLFPTDHVVWTRAWKMADLIPFLGHVGIEKMHCDRPGLTGEFVRVIANTAPRPIPRCQHGPGASCRLEDFARIVGEGASDFSAWQDVCGTS